MKNKAAELTAKLLFLACAAASIIAVFTIAGYIFAKGVPAIGEIGVKEFLFGMRWEPEVLEFGIFPMILTTIVVSLIAFFFGSFLGKWAAVYLALFCKRRIYRILKPAVELLAGIPSVVYGFFGAVVIVPLIRDTFGGPGKSLLAAVLILTIMILPTIINLSETAIRAVPASNYENALALGLRPTEAAFGTVVPAARSGIRASYVLGIGRAVGETMAVILISGNNPQLPFGLLRPVRTLTTGIALEMGYASGLHQAALFGIGVVLFVMILVLNVLLGIVSRRSTD